MKMFDLHVLSVLRAFIPSQNKTLGNFDVFYSYLYLFL